MNTLWIITFVNSTIVLLLVVVDLLLIRGLLVSIPWMFVLSMIGIFASIYGAVVGTLALIRRQRLQL